MDYTVWRDATIARITGLSRTTRGTGDTSVSPYKPALLIADGHGLALRAQENLSRAAQILWEQGEAKADKLYQTILAVVVTVNSGLVAIERPTFRTWDMTDKYPQMVPPERIAIELQEFCRKLADYIQLNTDMATSPVPTAAWCERELDWKIHPFADGCGRVSKLLGAWVLGRMGHTPLLFESHEAYYRAMNQSYGEWCSYYTQHVVPPQHLVSLKRKTSA